MKRRIQWGMAYILVYFLRKLKVSCIIGFDIHGNKKEVQTKQKTTLYFDSNFNDVTIKNHDSTVFNMPKGKFWIVED